MSYTKEIAVAALAGALGADRVSAESVDRVLGGYVTEVDGRFYRFQTVGDLAGKVLTSSEPDAEGGVSPVVVGG